MDSDSVLKDERAGALDFASAQSGRLTRILFLGLLASGVLVLLGFGLRTDSDRLDDISENMAGLLSSVDTVQDELLRKMSVETLDDLAAPANRLDELTKLLRRLQEETGDIQEDRLVQHSLASVQSILDSKDREQVADFLGTLTTQYPKISSLTVAQLYILTEWTSKGGAANSRGHIARIDAGLEILLKPAGGYTRPETTSLSAISSDFDKRLDEARNLVSNMSTKILDIPVTIPLWAVFIVHPALVGLLVLMVTTQTGTIWAGARYYLALTNQLRDASSGVVRLQALPVGLDFSHWALAILIVFSNGVVLWFTPDLLRRFRPDEFAVWKWLLLIASLVVLVGFIGTFLSSRCRKMPASSSKAHSKA